MTLVQLGFLSPLNWNFVALNGLAAAQIIEFLPRGLQEGLNLKPEQVQIQRLVPLETSDSIGYVTTAALVFLVSNMVDTIALDLHIPPAAIYQNPDPTIQQLMSYINPNIPIIPGAGLPGASASGTGTSSTATSAPGGNNGIIDNSTNDQNTQSAAAKKSTAGIAVSVVGAAAAYGAAMFFIARRYKRRRQSHRRTSSVLSNSEMRQSGSPALTGGAYMAGARLSSAGGDRNSRGSGRTGNSARTQQISAPMMAENSLGWN
jgi:hypothetical protein